MCFIEGLTDQEILRKEMVAQLCMGDKTHSQLVDLISFNEKTLMMQCSSTRFACSWKFDVDNVFYQVLAKNLINLFLDQTLLLYTPTFTQQNEHCDWLILGHMPLIKFKCIPTRIQLRNCCPCAEYNSMFLPYDCLRESLNILQST